MLEELGEGPHYADPQADVVFGDIFETGFLRDIFVREDGVLMGGGPLPPTLAPKVGAWMSTKLEQGPIDLYSPAFPPKPETRYALAHASFRPDEDTYRAILISDSCLTATALAQGRHKRSVGGRLLFAPLTVVEEGKWHELVATEDFERFPLPADNRLPAFSVAEFANCFMVDARDVKKYAASRVASLTEPLVEELEVHWNAYATRRGPRAYGRNTLKLASLLSGGGQPGENQERAADAVAAALDLALLLEGSDLEDVSDAEEAVRLVGGDAAALTPPLVDRIIDHLRELAELASEAAEEIAAYRRT
ncbi:MAG: hypothetical protein MSC31_12480 [Solirubrobacteraceae bacterium MAG38_C4-C5]|nr:hypothetical protein [Candidatus Siliceabacter maunaloa]